ncbi:MAG: outer membrane beta-barrel protein [Ginsengibacter sp.]
MEENKFEKQVKRKMDELKLQPSEELWSIIANRIEKKKRPGWGFLFLFLLLCAFLSGGYFIWHRGHVPASKEKYVSKINAHENNIKAKIDKNKNVAKDVISDSSHRNKDKANNLITNKNVKVKILQRNKIINASKIVSRVNSRQKTSIVSTEPEEGNIQKKKNVNQPIPKPPGISLPNETGSKQEVPIGAKINNDSLAKPGVSNNNEPDTVKLLSQKKAGSKQSRKDKWYTGVLISGGISSTGNSFLSQDKSAYSSYPGNLNSGPGITFQASEARAGFGMIVGVFEEKGINPKTKISFGVNYTSFATTSNIGKINDTTGLYNSRNPVNNFTAHYHFIELPIMLTVQIGRGKNMPFFWQGGVSVSGLLHTNALQFNPGTGYYYRDNSIFNKMQIGLRTSLSVELFSKQKHSILIGPYVSYDASRIANDGLYNKKHFVYTGVRAAIILGK